MTIITDDNVYTAQDSTTFERKTETWKARRPLWFKKCVDTQKTIWPLTSAYYSNKIEFASLANSAVATTEITSPDVGAWITPAAYTYRKLTRE